MIAASFTAKQIEDQTDTFMPGLSEIVAELVEHADEEVVERFLIDVINKAKPDSGYCWCADV